MFEHLPFSPPGVVLWPTPSLIMLSFLRRTLGRRSIRKHAEKTRLREAQRASTHIPAAGEAKSIITCRVSLLDGTDVSVDLPVRMELQPLLVVFIIVKVLTSGQLADSCHPVFWVELLHWKCVCVWYCCWAPVIPWSSRKNTLNHVTCRPHNQEDREMNPIPPVFFPSVVLLSFLVIYFCHPVLVSLHFLIVDSLSLCAGK